MFMAIEIYSATVLLLKNFPRNINGVKKTSELLPLCHPLSLDHISIHTEIDEKNNTNLAMAESADNGKPLWLTKQMDIPRCAENIRFFRRCGGKFNPFSLKSLR